MTIILALNPAQEYLTQALAYVDHNLADLQELAKKNTLVSIVLPVLSLFPFGVAHQVLSALLVITNILSGECPAWLIGLSSWMHKTTPYHMPWYYRVWLLLYAADLYFTAIAFDFRGWPRLCTIAYTLLKLVLVFAPFFDLTSDDRMFLWALAALFYVYDCWAVHELVQGICRGIDWRFNSIYAAWGPNFHYRRPSGNRQIVIMWAPFAYPLFKIPFAVGLWRDASANTFHTSSYHVPAKHDVAANLLADFSSLSLFTEPDTVVNLRYGVLFLLALSSLSVYSIILAGWSSNSKYAFIGALRSAAQMVSYEVSISLILLPVILMSGSLNFSAITYMQSLTVWFAFPLLPVSCLFLIAMLAETNRTPFDLPEAEAELVAGYNVDYSSLPFAMFFLGEYCNMILISAMYCLLFLAGGLTDFAISSSLILALKAAVLWIFFVNVRATLPRYRYDQLMDIGWKVFLPLAGGFVVLVFGILVLFNALPVTTELPLDVWNSFYP